MKTRKDFSTGRRNEEIGTAAQIRKNKSPEAEVKYKCPMECHGDEVFDEPGICPDSKMQMIPVGGGYIFY